MSYLVINKDGVRKSYMVTSTCNKNRIAYKNGSNISYVPLFNQTLPNNLIVKCSNDKYIPVQQTVKGYSGNVTHSISTVEGENFTKYTYTSTDRTLMAIKGESSNDRVSKVVQYDCSYSTTYSTKRTYTTSKTSTKRISTTKRNSKTTFKTFTNINTTLRKTSTSYGNTTSSSESTTHYTIYNSSQEMISSLYNTSTYGSTSRTLEESAIFRFNNSLGDDYKFTSKFSSGWTPVMVAVKSSTTDNSTVERIGKDFTKTSVDTISSSTLYSATSSKCSGLSCSESITSDIRQILTSTTITP